MTKDIKKIAIIGMGIAGISALREWTKQQAKDPAIEITLFGDKKTFGRGMPYQKDDPILIMNQPAELATIVPERKDDFVDWLKNTQGEENPRYGYYPRPLFGQYLYERMDVWRKQSHAKVVKEKVKKIEYLPNQQFRVQSASMTKDFDVVHLGIGIAPYSDYYGLIEHPHFIVNPFPVREKLAAIPKDARVGVLGTGLTSIDILRYFAERRPDIQLSFFSHSGRFKTARGETISYEYQYFTEENIKQAKAKNNGFIPLTTYFDWFKKEAAYQGVHVSKDWFNQSFGSKEGVRKDLEYPHEIGVVQTLILGMDRFLTEIWMALTDADKAKFFDDYQKKWDKIRSSFPVESGEILVALWDANKINVFADVKDVVQKEEAFEFILENEAAQSVDYIVNAAGSEKEVSFQTKRMPLLSQMLNERILQAEQFGGVQVCVPHLSAMSQRYGVLNHLKVHGPLISGIQFGNNSIDIISEGVQTAVQDIIKLQ